MTQALADEMKRQSKRPSTRKLWTGRLTVTVLGGATGFVLGGLDPVAGVGGGALAQLVGSGAVLTAECTVLGNRTTNGQDNSTIDDGNPGLYSSTRWYGIRWGDGRFGYISEVWISGQHRTGLGLRNC